MLLLRRQGQVDVVQGRLQAKVSETLCQNKWVWWCVSVNPAPQEVEIGLSQF
jgi:hypothetical protein